MKNDPKLPWMKWYPGDWRNDTSVQKMRRENRMTWAEALWLMHFDNQNYCITGTRADLARLLGITRTEFRAFLADLKHTGAAEVEEIKGTEPAQKTAQEDPNSAQETAPRGKKPRSAPARNSVPTIFRIICRRYKREWDTRKYDRERKAAHKTAQDSGNFPEEFRGRSQKSESEVRSQKSEKKKKNSLTHSHARYKNLAQALSEQIPLILKDFQEKGYLGWTEYREIFETGDRFEFIEQLEASREFKHVGEAWELHIELIRNEIWARYKKRHCTAKHFKTVWLDRIDRPKETTTNGNGKPSAKPTLNGKGSNDASRRNGHAPDPESDSRTAARLGANILQLPKVQRS